jgi:hypothetical protein
VPSQPNFIFYDQNVHVIEILFTAKNLRAALSPPDPEAMRKKVTGLLRFVRCLFQDNR